MKRCPGCNHQVPDSAQSCDYCGISLGSAAHPAGPEAKRQSTLPFAPDAGRKKGPEPRRSLSPITSRPERMPPAGEPPLVMVGGKLDKSHEPLAQEPMAPVRKQAARPTPQLPATPIGLDEAFKAGLDLVSNVFQILRGTWKIRSLNHQRNHAFDALAREVWSLQLRHRDLSPIFDRVLDIERQEVERRAAIGAIGQERLSDDPDIAKAEKALQKVKIRKLNKAIALLAKSKAPLFRELGKAANDLRIPNEALNPAYAYIEDITQRINHAGLLIEEARSAIRSIDKRKREFTYLFWICLLFMGFIIVWALIDVLKAPK